ncbi:MAG: TonB-dependent receptor [Lewinellaceae bacterium]|nr:TonB-dependent receptor [Lewinellaceae bacterium]
MNRICSSLMLLLSGIPAGNTVLAQAGSVQTLPMVTIEESSENRTGFSTWTADSLPLNQVITLAERLLWETPLDVRANAPGALTTVSARGAGPSRTAVFWKGVNLQNPMHGVVDISLLPLWAGDAVEIQFGGQSAAKSGGAMGGAVQLTPATLPDSVGWTTQFGAGLGSFGNKSGQASLGFSENRLKTQLRAAWQQADNDFPYRNTALLGQPVVSQQNNFTKRTDFQHYFQFAPNEDQTVQTAIWYQNAFREIPPSMTAAPDASWQKDRALRAVAGWEHKLGQHTQWRHNLAWLDETIAFDLTGDTDTSRSQTIQFSNEYFKACGDRFSIRANLTGWWQRAQADGYADSSQWFRQYRLAAVFGATYQWRRLEAHAQVRQEWAEGQGAPFTWSVGVRWKLPRHFFLNLHISRNFNLPTFNDRFWRNLGNPELRPESGYSSEIGLRWLRNKLMLEASVFQLLLDDWILWQPGTDGLFRPDNLRQVWSRGASVSGHLKVGFWRSQWKFSARYHFVRATNTAVYDANAIALHKLLPYTPEHQSSVSMHWIRGPWSVSYLHQWTGARFTTSDNVMQISGFHTGNVFFQYSLPVFRQRMVLNARIENCWNRAYQIIAYRPMPGRSWQAGFLWKI